LGRGGNATINGQKVEKSPDFGLGQFLGVSPPMEADEMPDPMPVGLLGARAKVAASADGGDTSLVSGRINS
jgi:hypothetical protein